MYNRIVGGCQDDPGTQVSIDLDQLKSDWEESDEGDKFVLPTIEKLYTDFAKKWDKKSGEGKGEGKDKT